MEFPAPVHFYYGNMVNRSNQAHPDSKVYGANMGPTWVMPAPDGPHVGPINLAVGAVLNTQAAFLSNGFEYIVGECSHGMRHGGGIFIQLSVAICTYVQANQLLAVVSKTQMSWFCLWQHKLVGEISAYMGYPAPVYI